MSRLLAISAALAAAGATAASAVGQQIDVVPAPPTGGSVLDSVPAPPGRFHSLRDLTQGATRANLGFVVEGQPWAGGLILGTADGGLFFGDSLPDDCIIGGACPGGTRSGSLGGDLGLAGAIFPVDPANDIYDIAVSTFMVDGSDMFPSANTINGSAVTGQARFEVGGFNIGGPAIAPKFAGMVFDVLSADYVIFFNGNNPFFPAGTQQTGTMFQTVGDPAAPDATPALFGRHIFFQNFADFGINEFQLVWRVQISPTPGATALFGLAGLAAVRRRRA